VRSIAISVSACMSVCISDYTFVRVSRKQRSYGYVALGMARFPTHDVLSTSGIVDDVMFVRNDIRYHRHNRPCKFSLRSVKEFLGGWRLKVTILAVMLSYIFYAGVSLAGVSCRRRWPPPTTIALPNAIGLLAQCVTALNAPASAFRQPSTTCRTAFPAQHLRPSGVLSCWPNGLELSRILSISSGIRRAAQTVLGVYLKRTCSRVTSASNALGVLNDMRYTNPRTHNIT